MRSKASWLRLRLFRVARRCNKRCRGLAHRGSAVVMHAQRASDRPGTGSRAGHRRGLPVAPAAAPGP